MENWMNTSTDKLQSQDGGVLESRGAEDAPLRTLLDVADVVSRHVWLLLAVVGVIAGASVLIAVLSKPKYDAQTTLYYVTSSPGSMWSQTGELARSLGFSVPTAGMQLEVPDIARSRLVRDSLLERRWSPSPGQDSQTLYELWGLAGVEEGKRRERAYRILGKRISCQVSDSGLIRIVVRMETPFLAAEMANSIADVVLSYLREEHTRSASLNRQYIDVRLAEVKGQLTEAEERLKEFREKNRRVEDSPDLMTQEGRMLRDVEVNQQVYLVLKEQSELARIDEIRDTPPLSVLDLAIVPWEKAYPRRVAIVLVGLLLGLVAGMVIVLLCEGSRILTSRGESHARWVAIRDRLRWGRG
jgi:uncharacterized protein involved in exopolysaccharide biosynthesis